MKNLIIALIIITLVVLGYRFVSSRQKGREEKPAETVFSSLKEALTAQTPLKCEVEVEEGKKVVVYIKGEKQKVEGVGYEGEGQGIMINDGQYVYIWNKEKKEGIKYKLTAIGEEKPSEEYKPPEEWIEEYQDYQPNCKPALISDETFVPPNNVAFKDLDELFKGSEGIEEDLPSSGISSEDTEAPSQEEIEKIIKEFEPEE